MQAFHGDERLKDEAKARLDHDFATGAIERGPTVWHDGRGSVAGALLRSADLSLGQPMLGMPRDVLALLDHLTGHIYFKTLSAADIARDFLAACVPGADLRSVPDDVVARLRADPAGAGETDIDAAGAASNVIDLWLDDHARAAVRASGWSEDHEAAAQAALRQLWKETRDRRHDGDWPSYPILFRERDPDLSRGYEQALALYNQTFIARVRQVVKSFLTAVGQAPIVADRAADDRR